MGVAGWSEGAGRGGWPGGSQCPSLVSCPQGLWWGRTAGGFDRLRRGWGSDMFSASCGHRCGEWAGLRPVWRWDWGLAGPLLTPLCGCTGDELELIRPSVYRNVARQLNISLQSETVVTDAFLAVAAQIFSAGGPGHPSRRVPTVPAWARVCGPEQGLQHRGPGATWCPCVTSRCTEVPRTSTRTVTRSVCPGSEDGGPAGQLAPGLCAVLVGCWLGMQRPEVLSGPRAPDCQSVLTIGSGGGWGSACLHVACGLLTAWCLGPKASVLGGTARLW